MDKNLLERRLFEVLCGVCDNDSFAVRIMACAETDETRHAIIDYIEQNKPTAADVSHYAAEIGRNRYSKKQGRANTANKKDKKLLRRLYDAARSLCQDRDFLLGTGSCATCDEDMQAAIDFIEWMKPTPSEVALYQVMLNQRRYPENYIEVDCFDEDKDEELLRVSFFDAVYALNNDKTYVLNACSKVTQPKDMRIVIDFINRDIIQPLPSEVNRLIEKIEQGKDLQDFTDDDRVDKKLLRRLYDLARNIQDDDFVLAVCSFPECDEDIQSAIDFIEWMKPTPSEILLYQIEIDQRRHPEDYIWVDEPYEEEEEREILSRRLFNEVHGLHRDKDFVMDVCSKITDLADMRRVIDLIDQKDKPSLREVTLLVDDIHQRRWYERQI